MRNDTTPIVKDLVLVGGGHAHVSVLKSFGMKPVAGVRVTVISRDVQAPYSGMLPGLIAGHYTYDDVHIDLGPLAHFAGARFYHDRLVGLDLENKLVLCAGRPPVPYDVLSLNTGSAPRQDDVPGAAQHTVPVKPIDRFGKTWDALYSRVMAQESPSRSGPLRIGVVGGGAGGVEVLLAMRHRLLADLAAQGRDPGGLKTALEFFLITQAAEILPTHNRSVQNKFMRVLADQGVTVLTGEKIIQVDERTLISESGLRLALDEILWVTVAGAPVWPGASGLATDGDGFIQVADTLQSVSHPGVFAAGDIAAVDGHPRPKSGVFAVRQGRPLTANLRRALVGKALKPFAPQRKFLSLITTGGKHAIASRGGWALEGKLIWRWKDWIDRRFMDKFNVLPDMADEDALNLAPGVAGPSDLAQLSGAAMRCGGCGAKVGSVVLHHALAQLKPLKRNDVLVGLSHPDDAAIVEVPPGKVMVQTVDGFRAFVDDPYLFGKIAANHCLGDIYAMGAEPQTALALATLPFGIDRKVRDDLVQMLSGALEILNAAGAALVGGHTAEGAELALGFSINGFADRDQVLRKRGAQVGDRLILTKPLGTGVLFAAHMRGKASGRWIERALAVMTQSSKEAARILRDFGASAATDVTGFGLAGHLIEILTPSEVSAEIYMDRLPVLDGAREIFDAGITSSLHDKNRGAVATAVTGNSHPDTALLYDPQTAGGLLCCVPAGRAEACVERLRAQGYGQAAIIGTIITGAHDGYTVRLVNNG